MNSKIVSIKRFSAFFLAIVLVTGTIAVISSSSSFMINAQAQPYYGGIDNNDRKSHGNDNYKSQKDSNSKSISLNKVKCINDNININGGNAGNVSIGNKKGQEYLGANAYGEYYDGYGNNNKQGKGFDCIINNNNTNTNIVIGGGNVTDGDVVDTCEECFSVNSTLQAVIENFLIDATGEVLFVVGSETLIIPGDVDTIEQLCPLLEDHTDSFVEFVITVIVERQIGSAIGNEAAIDALVECLLEAGVIVEATV